VQQASSDDSGDKPTLEHGAGIKDGDSSGQIEEQDYQRENPCGPARIGESDIVRRRGPEETKE
jgi:hypothetical protein